MNDNVSIPGENNTENKSEEKKVENKPVVSIKEGLSHFSIGAILALASFGIAYGLASWLFGEDHYIWRTVSTIFISYIFINSYDQATANRPTLKAGPVKNFTILFSFILLVNSYNNYEKHNFNSLPNDSKKNEIVKSTEENLFIYDGKSFVATAKKFNPGDRVKVIVRQHTVKLNDELLEPGEYNVPITGTGPLVFDRVSDAPANVEVYY